MSNKSSGTAFEKEFAQMLSEHGFWVHRLQDNHNGQPFDVIAARDGRTFVFDCKDCKSPIFMPSRIEENQINSMELWESTGNEEGLLAFCIRGEVYILSLKEALKKGRMTQEAVCSISLSFAEWYKRTFKSGRSL